MKKKKNAARKKSAKKPAKKTVKKAAKKKSLRRRKFRVECERDGVIGTFNTIAQATALRDSHQKPGHETLIIPV